jgi:flagellar basal body-associated protein FliL
MDNYTENDNKETHIPVWLISLVVLGVIGVLAILLVSFFGSSL